MTRSTTSAVLSVRGSRDERILLERSSVTILAADWDRLEAWVDAPAKDVPALRKLSVLTPVWQD